MNAGVIAVLVVASAAMACTNPETRTAQDRAANSGIAAPTGVGGNMNAARTDAASPGSNSPGVGDRTREVDNTGINERDRQATITPVDQGNSEAETNITASIRKGIMADDQLSFMGKNVKVITVGNKVTLRGPVKSDQARVAIAALATRTAGVTEVDNQLEVKN